MQTYVHHILEDLPLFTSPRRPAASYNNIISAGPAARSHVAQQSVLDLSCHTTSRLLSISPSHAEGRYVDNRDCPLILVSDFDTTARYAQACAISLGHCHAIYPPAHIVQSAAEDISWRRARGRQFHGSYAHTTGAPSLLTERSGMPSSRSRLSSTSTFPSHRLCVGILIDTERR